MSHWAIMQNIIEAEDAPSRLAYVKFMPDTGTPCVASVKQSCLMCRS